MCGMIVGPQNIPWSRSRSKFHEKWPFFAIILPWMARYGSKRSFLLIFSARDDLVKVSWKSDVGKCQNQLTPPYFDQLSERHQLLSTAALLWFDLFGTCVAIIKIIRLSLKKRDLETYSHCPVLTILGRPLTPFTSWNCPKSFGSGTSVEESNINITSQYESYKI